MPYLLIKRSNLPSLNVKYSIPKNEALCLTGQVFSVRIYSYKRDEKNILSGIYNLISFTHKSMTFGGTSPTPPANCNLINNNLVRTI